MQGSEVNVARKSHFPTALKALQWMIWSLVVAHANPSTEVCMLAIALCGALAQVGRPLRVLTLI